MIIQKATKEKTKARIAIYGPSGAGKTYTALSIASGMGKKIGAICSENRSMRKYSDRFEFDVIDLDKIDRTVAGYVKAIKMFNDAKYDVLIIDSLSHAWKELKKEVERIAAAKFGGNTWAAWSQGNPMQDNFINTILEFEGHIISTMRSNTDWVIEKNDKGKTMPVRVGLSPDQGKGIEYEFDMLLEINQDHWATVIKDRTGKFQDQSIEKPGKELGSDIASWLSDGAEVQIKTPSPQLPKTPLHNTVNLEKPSMFDWTKAKDEISELVKKVGMKIEVNKSLYFKNLPVNTKPYTEMEFKRDRAYLLTLVEPEIENSNIAPEFVVTEPKDENLPRGVM